MKEKICGWLKFLLLVSSMIMGFWLAYAWIWYAVGLPLENWALLLLLALAGLTEWAYIKWVIE